MIRKHMKRTTYHPSVEDPQPSTGEDPKHVEPRTVIHEIEDNLPQKSPKDPWIYRANKMVCKTCMWFVLKSDRGPLNEIGRCRRRSPSPDGSLGWPVVLKADWCGSHELDETKVD